MQTEYQKSAYAQKLLRLGDVLYPVELANSHLFKSHDFRVRNFINLVAVKFPKGLISKLEHIQQHFERNFKNGVRNFRASEFIPYVQEIPKSAWTSWDVFNAKRKNTK